MTNDNIVLFKTRPVEDSDTASIGLCECGSQWFWLVGDGEIQCTQCDIYQHQRWFDPGLPT